MIQANLNIFTNTQQLKDLGLLVDNDHSYRQIIGHELTHSLENTETYSDLREALYDYAKSNNVDIDSRLNEIKELYDNAKIKNYDADNELTSDLASELFEDEEFVNKLTKKRTTFEKIKDFIDNLATKFVGTADEKKMLKIKQNFEKAYKQLEDTKLSKKKQWQITAKNFEITSNEDSIDFVKRYINNSNNNSITQREIGELAESYYDQTGKDSDEFRKEINDYIDKYGMDSLADIEEKNGMVYNNGEVLKVSKDEHTVMQDDYSKQKNLYKKDNKYYFLRTANNLYYANVDNGEIRPILRIKAGTNQELATSLEKGEIDYDRVRRNLNSIVTGQWDSKTITNWYNNDVKGNRTTSKNDRIFSQEQEFDIRPDNGKGIGNIRGEQVAPFNNGQYSIRISKTALEQDIVKYLLPQIEEQRQYEDKSKITETIYELKEYTNPQIAILNCKKTKYI